ncbi:glycosyltransferase family 2 protein [Streptomyces sp. HPF1205]|uniref:glycosyltransferase n=1 Tax=Streptomyces sp. HPF1205 TaxID=2873262 RepID=UPI001CEC1857|nr:glycosyltransferase [Streptomyces sp. HPF1205]
MTSIVIPAHNEAPVIGRLLDALLSGPADGPAPDVVVVCNGCTDDTAKAAARPGVRVVEVPLPSKHDALRTGDAHARGFPRLYVDADVVIGAADVRALAETVAGGGPVLAAAPARDLPMTGCAWPVRAYYRVWQRLPAVREGLFGRGVIAVSREGHARLAALPPLMADDLAASLAFAPGERRVVEQARVTVRPPRTWADLIRRRVRADTSSAQLEARQAEEARRARAGAPAPAAGGAAGAGTAAALGSPAGNGGGPDAGAGAPGPAPAPSAPAAGAPGPPPSARTRPADLRRLLYAEPWLLPHVAVFLTVAAVARRTSRKAIRDGDFDTWLRDESSRRD